MTLLNLDSEKKTCRKIEVNGEMMCCSETWIVRSFQNIHELTQDSKFESFDSVRGLFIEGEPVYPGSGFYDKTHIQICVVNPNCIKGYFSPLIIDANYSVP
jgi:hypothetical protein